MKGVFIMTQKNQELMLDLAEPGAMMAIIMSLAEIIKQVGLPAKFIPLVDIGLGVAVSLARNLKEKGVGRSLLIGVALGLSSCGTFSGVKNLMG